MLYRDSWNKPIERSDSVQEESEVKRVEEEEEDMVAFDRPN